MNVAIPKALKGEQVTWCPNTCPLQRTQYYHNIIIWEMKIQTIMSNYKLGHLAVMS